jgi:uncharacterized protein YndB with AHSA1/START domain
MAHADNSVVINAPVQRVFEVVADGTQNGKWRDAVLDIALVQGDAGKAGAMYKQGLNGPGGRRMDGDYKLAEVVPNEVIVFNVIAGPAHPSGKYTFETVEGGTKVGFALDLQTRGLQKLIDPMITATMRKEVGSLANLKEYLEQR